VVTGNGDVGLDKLHPVGGDFFLRPGQHFPGQIYSGYLSGFSQQPAGIFAGSAANFQARGK
jgi:hypothetical protein